ncbi:MAG: hypothetical protein IT449_13325 [Phycisphaerales bacterium]|nr:hypothetical protein [Phycisphaerales bacterium]
MSVKKVASVIMCLTGFGLASLPAGCQSSSAFPLRAATAPSQHLIFNPEGTPRGPLFVGRQPWPAWIEQPVVGDYAEYEVQFHDVSGLIQTNHHSNTLGNTTIRSTHELRTGHGRTPR